MCVHCTPPKAQRLTSVGQRPTNRQNTWRSAEGATHPVTPSFQR